MYNRISLFYITQCFHVKSRCLISLESLFWNIFARYWTR